MPSTPVRPIAVGDDVAAVGFDAQGFETETFGVGDDADGDDGVGEFLNRAALQRRADAAAGGLQLVDAEDRWIFMPCLVSAL
jgi:hypothetical protein